MWSTGRFSEKVRVFLQKTRRASVLDCGLISKKSEEFLAKYPERDSGSRVDFRKAEGFFRKITTARPIWAVRAGDRTATKSRRRGRAGCASWPHRIISLEAHGAVGLLGGGRRCDGDHNGWRHGADRAVTDKMNHLHPTILERQRAQLQGRLRSIPTQQIEVLGVVSGKAFNGITSS